MPVYITAYLGTLISFCVLDFLWLGIIAKGFYQTRFGTLMLEQPKLIPAAAFYLLYVVGLLVFAVLPALRAQSTLTAVGFGAFLGLIAYGCYDLTNLSTLKGWSLS